MDSGTFKLLAVCLFAGLVSIAMDAHRGHKQEVIRKAEEASRYARTLPYPTYSKPTYQDLMDAACSADLPECR